MDSDGKVPTRSEEDVFDPVPPGRHLYGGPFLPGERCPQAGCLSSHLPCAGCGRRGQVRCLNCGEPEWPEKVSAGSFRVSRWVVQAMCRRSVVEANEAAVIH